MFEKDAKFIIFLFLFLFFLFSFIKVVCISVANFLISVNREFAKIIVPPRKRRNYRWNEATIAYDLESFSLNLKNKKGDG